MTRIARLVSLLSVVVGVGLLAGCACSSSPSANAVQPQKLSVAEAQPLNAPDVDWRMRESYTPVDLGVSAR